MRRKYRESRKKKPAHGKKASGAKVSSCLASRKNPLVNAIQLPVPVRPAEMRYGRDNLRLIDLFDHRRRTDRAPDTAYGDCDNSDNSNSKKHLTSITRPAAMAPSTAADSSI